MSAQISSYLVRLIFSSKWHRQAKKGKRKAPSLTQGQQVRQVSDRENMSLAGEDLPDKKCMGVLVTVGAAILKYIQVVITIRSFANRGENGSTDDDASE